MISRDVSCSVHHKLHQEQRSAISLLTLPLNNNNKRTFIFCHLQEKQNSSGLQIEVAYKIEC